MVKQVEISKDNIIIDHKSPLSYYFQLKELLVNKIKNGRLKPEQQIPSEFKLCNQAKDCETSLPKPYRVL